MAAIRRFASKACSRSEPNTTAELAPMDLVQNDATGFPETTFAKASG